MPMGLVLIERMDLRKWNTDQGRPMPRNPVAPLTWDLVLERYSGIDGKCWPQELLPYNNNDYEVPCGLLSLEKLPMVLSWPEWRACEKRCDLLLCETIPDYVHDAAQVKGFDFVGYDVGMPITEDTFYSYSLVYQEIIFGMYPELTEFTSSLNRHLLFDNIEAYDEFLRVRHRAAVGGADLEEFDSVAEMASFRVFRYRV